MSRKVNDIALVNRGFKDLNPRVLGEEQCVAAHRYGPAIRPYTLIHFVIKGCGTYEKGGVEYQVHAGEAFIILPGEVTVYHASETDPWHYQWIGFDGSLSTRFAELPPVIRYAQNWAGEMLQCDENDGMLEYKTTALLFGMYGEFFASQKHSNHYVRRVKNYIQAMYMQQVRVERIAQIMNLDRRYLSRLFKEKTGQSIQDYLISVRIEAAQKHLKNGASVAEAAQLCGYDDVCNFSKMFKRLTGLSPGQWREK